MKNKKSRRGDVEFLFIMFIVFIFIFALASGGDDEDTKADSNSSKSSKVTELEFNKTNFKKLQKDIKIREEAFIKLLAEREEEKRQTLTCLIELKDYKLVNKTPVDDYSSSVVEDSSEETGFGTGY